MSATTKELLEKRAKVLADARKLNDEVVARGTPMTKDEDAKWAAMNADADRLKADADRTARFESIDAEERNTPGRENVRPGRGATGEVTDETRATALGGWFARGHVKGPTSEQRAAAEAIGFDLNAKEIEIPAMGGRDFRAIQRIMRTTRGARTEREIRDMSLTGANGGYTSVPAQLVSSLEQARLAHGGILQVAEVIRTATGEPMYWPAADDTGNSGELVAEAGDLNIEVSVDPTFARLQLDSYKVSSKPILVSYELLRDSVFDLPSVIGAMLGERIGRKESAMYATADGSSKPRGITVAGTAATLSSGNAYTASATAITGDEILDLVHSVDPAYRGQGCGFVMKDSTVLLLRKLKGTDGQYLWQANWQAGAPDMLAGYPVTTCQDMPAATAGLKSVVFGQLSAYKVRQVGPVRLRRLDELFANTDQVGFLALASVDGDLQDAGTHPVKVLVQHA